ncbi:adenine nucleotide alpha hydrolase [Sedimentitalea sp. JM2-8]|uniref:Adenine nucleotide alpha hydrolase n=1 Tax=Sedimentitalea xiamensis TaxID=3050037 RepID=A0ABT7FDA1_9RHOB|nr:adenine nucleotide alpha hydrolase [Sedimentitalea xiamensis]MDK3073092.1 adenine nucleotide alpha hydrolase [Sedimentitalea xiamensis]
MSPRPAIMSWSSGKDSAFALHEARSSGDFEIVALLSNFNALHDRVAIHGTRRDVVRAQAAALDLPLIEVDLPYPCSNADYEALMGAATRQLSDDGIRDWIFGDLFLDDIRAYRESRLAQLGLTAHFPLWGRDTDLLARDMISAGLRAQVVTLDPAKLPRGLCGACFDRAFLKALPDGVDPCGERGEFHTVVTDAPGFRTPVDLVLGATVECDGFIYSDFSLAPAG